MIYFEGLTPQQIDWLTNKASLTQQLRTFTQDKITHHLLYDDWGILDQNEEAWIRKMEWRLYDETWIAATVMIPATSITPETDALTRIGKRSIGDILFQDPQLTRSDFTFSKEVGHGWSRQSVFYFKQHPLIIREHFYRAFFDAVLVHEPC